jgi:hypothetical protein
MRNDNCGLQPTFFFFFFLARAFLLLSSSCQFPSIAKHRIPPWLSFPIMLLSIRFAGKRHQGHWRLSYDHRPGGLVGWLWPLDLIISGPRPLYRCFRKELDHFFPIWSNKPTQITAHINLIEKKRSILAPCPQIPSPFFLTCFLTQAEICIDKLVNSEYKILEKAPFYRFPCTYK